MCDQNKILSKLEDLEHQIDKDTNFIIMNNWLVAIVFFMLGLFSERILGEINGLFT